MTDDQTPVAPPPQGPDIDRMRAAVRAQLFRAKQSLHDDDVIAERYRLERRIGSGSMATVWRAHDELEDRVVALKLLRSRDVFAGTGVERMLREAKLAGGLDHPNIVRVFDCGQYGDGCAYVAMALVEGRSLADYLAEQGPLPWARARAVLLQVADALAAAHASGVMHRDLKPANILLTESGDELHCTVIDFGLARPIGVDPNTGKLTGTGLVFGTPRYMSPEHVRAEPLDARADVYALGCLAYEMLTGHAAVSAETIADVLLDHLYRHPPGFAEVAPGLAIPDGVEAIVFRATRKDPGLRFPDMTALRTAVLALDRDEHTVVPEEVLRRPVPQDCREPRSRWWGGRIGILLMLVSGTVFAAAQVMP